MPDGAPLLIKSIAIKGGAQVADGTGFNLVTPLGVVTRLNDDEAELLAAHPVYIKHHADGFVSIESVREEVEKVVGDSMKLPDESEGAPVTEASIAKIAKPKGITVKAMGQDGE